MARTVCAIAFAVAVASASERSIRRLRRAMPEEDQVHVDVASDSHETDGQSLFQRLQGCDTPEELKNLVLLSGRTNPKLAQDIVQSIGIELGGSKTNRFADGEILPEINTTVRGRDVYIVQPTTKAWDANNLEINVNESLMELLLTISAARRGSAEKITAVVPYYGFARQDRKTKSRTPISAADVAQMITAMGADRVMVVDIHSGQASGFFPPHVPMDNLAAQELGVHNFIRELKANPGFADVSSRTARQQGVLPLLPLASASQADGEQELRDVCVVSPDAGGVQRAKNFQRAFMNQWPERTVRLATMIKHRAVANLVEKVDLVGDVDDCDAIIVDDMADTAGTLVAAAAELQKFGAKRVYAFITHAVFSGPAMARIANSKLEKMFITDSIAKREENIDRHPGLREKLQIVKLGALLGEAIRRVHCNESLEAIFSDVTRK